MVRTDDVSLSLPKPTGTRPLLRGLCAFLLGLPGSLPAEVPQAGLRGHPNAHLVLACPQPELKGAIDPALGRAFHERAFRDLADSGVVQPLQAGVPATLEAPSLGTWRRAGASLLMRTRLQRSWNGKLIIRVEVVDLGSEAEIFHKAYACVDPFVPSTVHRLVNDCIGALTGTPGVAGAKLVFAHEMAGGCTELFQVDPDGTNLARITHHGSLTRSPAVTANGRLSYVTYVGGLPQIWGRLSRKDTAHRLVPAEGAAATMAFAPAWSPNGKRLAFVQPSVRGAADIFIMPVGHGQPRPLTRASGVNAEPAWSPSGQQIAFTSDRTGVRQIYIMAIDGTSVRQMTQAGTANTSPAWSPDGKMLAYVSEADGHPGLFVLLLAEGKAYRVTLGGVDPEAPSWSPDGRWLAFAGALPEGQRHLYVANLSGTQVRQVLDLPHCQAPQWSRFQF